MLRRRFLLVAGVLALAVSTLFFAARLQAQKPGSSVIELTPPVTVNTGQTGVAPVPLGTQIRVGTRLVNVLKIITAPTGGSGQLLDVYFQYSADDGQTWQDFAHIQQSSTGTTYVPISAIAAGSTTVSSMQDGALGANTAIQGPIGDRLRIKYSTNMGTGTSGSWSFQAFVLPD